MVACLEGSSSYLKAQYVFHTEIIYARDSPSSYVVQGQLNNNGAQSSVITSGFPCWCIAIKNVTDDQSKLKYIMDKR